MQILPCPYYIRTGAQKRENAVRRTVILFSAILLVTNQKGGTNMNTFYIHTLYIDIQSLPPACFCPHCGGERYAPSLVCLRCERRGL